MHLSKKTEIFNKKEFQYKKGFETKEVHVTERTTGKTTRSVGIPGTGISYVETIEAKKRNLHAKSKKTIHIPDGGDQECPKPI